MMTIRVEHVEKHFARAKLPFSGRPIRRPYIGHAWFGEGTAATKDALVTIRGRTYKETLYATEAAAQAIARFGDCGAEEYYVGRAGDRVRFEPVNQHRGPICG